MQEYGGEELCPACLVGGRRVADIPDYGKQYFVQIINEIAEAEVKVERARMCWECSARLSAAVRFQRQVARCFLTLRDYTHEFSKPPLSTIIRPPWLRPVMLGNDHVSLAATDSLASDTHADPSLHETIKTEDVWCDWQQSKEEIQNEFKDEVEISVVSPDRNSFTLSDEEELKYLVADSNDAVTNTESRQKRHPGEIKREQAKSTKKKGGDRRGVKFKVVKLSHEEIVKERTELAQGDKFLSAEHKCESCLMIFSLEESLKQHLKTKHDPELGAFRCPTCEVRFRAASPLRQHAARHRRRYQCAACAARHHSKRRAALHAATCGMEPVKELKIRKSREKTPSELPNASEDLDAEVEADENAGDTQEVEDSGGPKSSSLFPCELCSKSFRWKTSLRKHAELHRIQSGQKKPPYCDACALSFTTTSNYKKHLKTSSKHQIQLKVRKLKELMEDGPAQAAPIEEIRTSVHNALNKFACPHCDKKFQWKGNLLRHIQSHKARADGELYCAPCDRKFSSIATYQQHMKISRKHVTENEFRFMCSECGRKFVNKTRLKDHVDWEHLKVYSHKCPLCQKVFKSNTSLYLHKQVVHRKDNGDHLCDHCGKPFPNRAKLRTHITAMHTAEQPFKCKLCVATFSWHSCLSRHVKVVHHKIKTKRKRKLKEDFSAPAPQALAAS